MKLSAGEVYVCLEPSCKAEVIVRKGADAACPSKYELRCCCGKEMVREEKLLPMGQLGTERKKVMV